MTKREDYTRTLSQFIEETTLDNGRLIFTISEMLDKLHRYEATLHRLAEDYCNIEMTEDQETRHFKKQESIQAKVLAIASELGFKVKFNQDPRGCAIRFILPSGKSNNWDGETWGIYW